MALYLSKEKRPLANTRAFLYRWTHVPTEKWYVGSRSAIGFNPEDGYAKSAISKEIASLHRAKCEHCGGEYSPALYGRWHGDKCKQKGKTQ